MNEAIELKKGISESDDLSKIKTLNKYLDEKLQRIKSIIDSDT